MILAHKIALDPTPAQAIYFARACWHGPVCLELGAGEWQQAIRAMEGIPVRAKAIRGIPAARVECDERGCFPVDAGGDEERAAAGDQEPWCGLQELL